MSEGYFKVHRGITRSQVFSHPLALKIWIWCLAKASYCERFISVKIGKGSTSVKILPGQFIFGRFKAEEELNIDGSTIYKWMQKFESSEFGMISIESNNQYSIITLCNWDEYQNETNGEVTTKEQPSNNQVTTKEQPSNTYNKVKKVYKVKKVKKDIPEFSSSVIDLFEKAILLFNSDLRAEMLKQKFNCLKSLRDLIEIDKHDPDQILNVITWAREDDFWKLQFLSISKLRRKNKEGISYFVVFDQQMKNKKSTVPSKANALNNHMERDYSNPETEKF
jgi:hypothetical protein